MKFHLLKTDYKNREKTLNYYLLNKTNIYTYLFFEN